MHIEKKVLCQLDRCYAASPIQVNGREHYLFATDDAGACVCVDPDTGRREQVWDAPGGTMSIVPLPGRDGEFLASQCFLPNFHALQARIVRATWQDGCWNVMSWLELPYVHRFDILFRGGVWYLLCCILTDSKTEAADFSAPGYLLVGKLSEEFSPPRQLRRLDISLPVNHGYWASQDSQGSIAYIGCDSGIFRVTPPDCPGKDWGVLPVQKVRSSDMALVDIDRDGVDEMAVIEPFHGDQLVIYRSNDDHFQEIYRNEKPLAFLHALWGGTLLGEPVFLCGSRGLEQKLFFLRWIDERFVTELIETGFGPSNVAVLHGGVDGKFLVANRESGECALFTLHSWD